MYNLKFFSRAPVEGQIPSYRAMACTSYEISPPMQQQSDVFHFADVVMHLLDSSCVTWPLKGNAVLYVENAGGTTIDKVRNPNPMPEPGVIYGPVEPLSLRPTLTDAAPLQG